MLTMQQGTFTFISDIRQEIQGRFHGVSIIWMWMWNCSKTPLIRTLIFQIANYLGRLLRILQN